MFSKALASCLTGFLSLLSVVALTGCEVMIGEEPPPPNAQEFSGTQCLSDAKPVAVAFIRGDAHPRDVEATWRCASDAVEKFKRYVRGGSSDRYTPQELATFLEQNFLNTEKNEVISVKLQNEFMKLKQLFIGGSGEYLTRAEIDKLVSLFSHFKDITLKLNPYMKVISLNWKVTGVANAQKDVKHFEAANAEIQNAARSIAALIEKNEQSYVLTDFSVLMEELAIFFGETWDFPRTINKFMPIIQKVKKALAGGDEGSVKPKEWSRFLLLGSRGYVQYMRYHYFMRDVDQTGTGYKLSYLASSVEDVLSIFKDLLSEKPQQIVTRDEVTELLKTLEVVWPEFKISNKLVAEAMKIKQLIFGGSAENFTTQDFEMGRSKVGRLKIVVERFMPYYPIYAGDWDPSLYSPQEAERQLQAAQKAILQAAVEASVLIEGPYDLQSLVTLTEEIDRLYPPARGKTSVSGTVKKFIPLVVDVKNMIMSGNDSIIRKDNWGVLATYGSRAYAEYLFYSYFVQGKSFSVASTLVQTSRLANRSLDILKDLITQKKEGYFSKAELAKLIRHGVRLDFIPLNLSNDSLNRLIDVVLNNFLVAPERRLGGYNPNALNVSAVEVARQELGILLETQIWIAQQTQNVKPEQGFTSGTLMEMLQKAKRNSAGKYLAVGVGEMMLTVSSPVPMTVDSRGRLNISNHRTQIYTAASLTRLNFSRGISRLLLRAFVTSRQRLADYTGANLAEVEGAFAKLRPMAVELGVLDPKNKTFASSRFREANIFVPHSDGNSLVSYAEMTDLVEMIWSGLNLNNMLRPQLLKDCFGGRKQVKNSEKVSMNCLLNSYYRTMPSVMTAMPGYLGYAKSIPSQEWVTYMSNIFKAAGHVPNAQNVVELEDISLAPHVIQYVEMIYARYDKDKNGWISTQESLAAFPAFKGILLELAKDQIASGTIKEDDLLDLFTFILRYGKPPTSISEKLRFVFKWKGKPNSWDVNAGRSHLAEILGFIADEVNKAAKQNKPVKLDFNLELSKDR